MVTVRVPATSANIGPGFDSVGLALDLYNYVTMKESDTFKIEISGQGENDIECGHDNIVYKAAKRVFEKTGCNYKELHIKLKNNIPVARGLGSSAAALVGGVVCANFLAGNHLTKQQLLEIVTDIEGHPDNVAPAIFGGMIASTVLEDGEIVWRKVELDNTWKFTVAIPEFTLSTKLSREALPQELPFSHAVYNISRVGLVILGFETRDLGLLAKVMDDRLHQPYRSKLVPGMSEVLTSLSGLNIPVALSGAGPTVLAMTDTEAQGEELCHVMSDIFAKYNVNCTTKVLLPNNAGAEIVE